MHADKIWNVKLAALMFLSILLYFVPLACMAEEKGILEGSLIETAADTTIKENPRADASDLLEVAAGTAMFVIGTEENGWYKVKLLETEGYVPKSEVALFRGSTELGKEFNEINAYDQKIFAAAKQAEFKNAENILWLVAMAILISLTVLVCVRESKKKKKQTEKEL